MDSTGSPRTGLKKLSPSEAPLSHKNKNNIFAKKKEVKAANSLSVRGEPVESITNGEIPNKSFTKNITNMLTWPIRKLLLFLIIGIRPLLGPAPCPYTVTCGKFAIQQLRTEPLGKALWSISVRLLNCMGLFRSKS